MALPDQAIIPIHRADGSGTTFVFADYLARVNAEWRDRIGVSTAVEFPTGIGGKGNEGVAGFTARTKGAIGYVEHSYAIRSELAYVSSKNREEEFVRRADSRFGPLSQTPIGQAHRRSMRCLPTKPESRPGQSPARPSC